MKSEFPVEFHKYLKKFDYLCFWDGATEPINPGGACGIGAIIFDSKKNSLFEYSHYIQMSPKNSNNVAEYLGFLELIKWFIKNKVSDKRVIFFGDSNLVVQQMNGNWRVKNGLYKKYAIESLKILHKLNETNEIAVKWIGRDLNYIADELSKKELKRNKIKFRLQYI